VRESTAASAFASEPLRLSPQQWNPRAGRPPMPDQVAIQTTICVSELECVRVASLEPGHDRIRQWLVDENMAAEELQRGGWCRSRSIAAEGRRPSATIGIRSSVDGIRRLRPGGPGADHRRFGAQPTRARASAAAGDMMRA